MCFFRQLIIKHSRYRMVQILRQGRTIHKSSFWAIAFISLCSACSSSGDLSELTPPVERLQAAVDAGVAAGIPGVSLVVQSGDQVWTINAGVTQLDGPPMSASTLLPIASAGKPYTSALVLRLAEEGFLQLDDPITQYLAPQINAAIPEAETISIKMLLAHTSGLPDYLRQDNYLADFAASPGRIWREIETLEYLADESLLFVPGSDFNYSNTNYLLLGLIVQQASSMSLADAMRFWVFEPANLLMSYHPLEVLGQAELAHGYLDASVYDFWAGNADVNTYDWVRHHSFADAPIHATAGDTNRFIRMLIDTDILLTENSKLQMFSPTHLSSTYGLGIFVLPDDDGDLAYVHTGGHWGYSSVMAYIPAKDISYVVLVNASDGHFAQAYLDLVSTLDSVIENIVKGL